MIHSFSAEGLCDSISACRSLRVTITPRQCPIVREGSPRVRVRTANGYVRIADTVNGVRDVDNQLRVRESRGEVRRAA